MGSHDSLDVPRTAGATVRLTIRRRALMRCLAVIIGVLTLLSVAEQYVIHILGRADLEEFLIAVDLDAEANIPTWYASGTLFACALLLGVVARRARRQGDGFAGHWGWLSGLFVLPLVGLAAGQFGGVLKAGPEYYALIGAIVLVLDIAILFSARRLFDRERLMSRWG